MIRASFSAAVILFLAALLCWIWPGMIFPLLVLAVVSAAVFLPLYLIRRSVLFRDFLFFALCLLVSVLFLGWHVRDYYETQDRFAGKTVVATVILTEDPQETSYGTYRYEVCPESDGLFSQKFSFYSSVYFTEAGGTVTATFTFFRPEASAFSDLTEGIVLNARLDTYWEHVVIGEPEPSFTSLSGSVRRYVHKVFLRYLGQEEGGFMTAVLTGDKDYLSDAHYTGLKDTGMLHIVAVSGLHVSIFVSFALFFLRKIPWMRLQPILSVAALFCILFFSGFTPSVCRAVIMNAVVFFDRGFARKSDAYNRLGLAAAVILLVTPNAALSLSFQLSFAAALGIIVLATPLTKGLIQFFFVRWHVICGSILRSTLSLFAVSLASFCFTLPVLWFRMGSFSVWSLILSPVVLPVLEICFFAVLVLLLLSLIPFLGVLCGFLGTFIRFGVNYMTYLSSSASSLMGLAESVHPAVLWIVAGAVLILGVILFVIPGARSKSKKKQAFLIRRGLAAILFAAALLTAYQAANQAGESVVEGEVSPSEGIIQTAFLDVGQGNCFVTVLGNQAYVVDCGGTKDPGHVASDYLTSAGIETVEFVLISHLHSDHANGLVDLCEEKEVKEIIIPYTEGEAALYARITLLAEEEGAILTVLEEDAERKLGSSTLRMLTEHLDPTSDDQNENSIVGLCEYGNYRVLFTGDITKAAEKRLVAAYGSRLRCDVLSVPHHGSRGSSCDEFMKAASPVYAVISVGAKNTYGHPTDDAIARITAVGASILRTDLDSTVTIRSDGASMEVVPTDEP